MQMTSDDVRALDAAVASVAERLSPEDRFDLRQELAIALLRRTERPKDVRDWARGAALKWTIDFQRDRRRQRDLLRESYVSRSGGGRYRTGDTWMPTWYAPCDGAREFAPFACEGARVMHVKGSAPTRAVQDALAEVLDSRRVSKT